ncbi:hypothetical protein [Winogradskya humida]|nr:hypothetical protein [Actinoplanes humidus]
MRSHAVNGDSRLPVWQRVREFAVPPPMIHTATTRRLAGDWAGACAAARFDVDIDLRGLARTHGLEFTGRVRDDLRHLAPDLLRWHLPRVAPDGLLRPGLTLTLARYGAEHLVARTAPAWADSGQRISLALWSGGPHPDRRFRLDLHRHLWDARRTAELRERSVQDWAYEAALLRHAENRPDAPVLVRQRTRRYLALTPDAEIQHTETQHTETPHAESTVAKPRPGDLLLPDAATSTPPDVLLLRAGLIDPAHLHPLVAAALAPGISAPPPSPSAAPHERQVDCRGVPHRIALVDGVLAPLDHDPVELRREELLVAFGGVPLPCLRVIDEANRNPAGLADIQGRLAHGDTTGALDAIEALLGPQATLRAGALRDELLAAAERRVTYGLYRAGMAGHCPPEQRVPRQRHFTKR